MTNLIYTFKENNVRVEMVNSEPWFVAKDVCEVLGIADTNSACRRLDDDEKGQRIVPTHGGNQIMTIVNESGLYQLIFTSRKEEAKDFRKWVTSEVLPSIRKDGGYLMTTEEDDAESIVAKALVVAHATLERKNRELAEKNNQITLLEHQVVEAAPKVNYYDVVLSGENLIKISVIAADYGMSGSQMNKLLHEHGVQYKQGKDWLLYKEHNALGYTKTHTYRNSHYMMKWTQKGRLWIYQTLKDNGILPLIEQE